MAVMIPEELPKEATDSEKDIYGFFKSLPFSYHGWFDQDVGGIRPDFLLYTPGNGLIVFEVKAWELAQIYGGDKYRTQLRAGLRYEMRKSPFGQVQAYLDELKGLMGEKGSGRYILPLEMGVILPNITRKEYLKREQDAGGNISRITDPVRTIFKDDLNGLRASPDRGAAFQAFLNEHFRPFFPMKHTPELLGEVKKRLLSKSVCFKTVCGRREGDDLIRLDEDQASAALSLRARCRLAGPAGSGKTVVLARRARYLLDKGQKRILFLCFNLSLAGYLRRMLSNNGVPLMPQRPVPEKLPEGEGVLVLPVFDLIACLNGSPVKGSSRQYFSDEADMARLVLQEEGCPHCGSWDAVLVDEGQDFTPAMADIVERLLKKGGFLHIAVDQAQNLYAPALPEVWKGMEVRRLPRRYRCTGPVMAFAEDWLAPENFLPGELLGRSGGAFPSVLTAQDEAEAARMAAEDIVAGVESGLPQGDNAVLYVKSGGLPALLERELARKGLMTVTASDSEESKRRYDITLDSVTLSTVHSMKGMDFFHVVLLLPLSCSDGRQGSLLSSMDETVRRESWEKARARNLPKSSLRSAVYVGMTRARESLTVIWYDDAGAGTGGPGRVGPEKEG